MKGYGQDFGFGFIIFIALGAYTLYKEDSKWLASVLFFDIYLYIISFCGYISGFGALFNYELLFGLPKIAIVSLSYALLLVSISPLFDRFRDGFGSFSREFGKNFGIFVLLVCLFLFESRDIFEVGEEEPWFVELIFLEVILALYLYYLVSLILGYFLKRKQGRFGAWHAACGVAIFL